MSIEMIGKQISALRREHGYKQEELAKAVGVSTQAVSKWENGGVPDTELLPSIADFFGVSIDFLFGRSITDYADLHYALMKKVNKIPENERMKSILNFCFDMERAMMVDANKEAYTSVEDYEKVMNVNEQQYSSVLYNNGFTLMGIGNRSQYFLVVPDAENTDSAYFNNIDYTAFFKDFSDKDLLDACIFFYKRDIGKTNKAFTPSLLEKNLGITQERSIEIINTLKKYSMIQSTQVEIDDELQTIYNFIATPSFIALLIFSQEIIVKPNRYSYYCDNRNTAYLK